MKIELADMFVGRWMVLGVSLARHEASVASYHSTYEQALEMANKNWACLIPTIYIVVEVQAKVCAQQVPNLTTKLTEKL